MMMIDNILYQLLVLPKKDFIFLLFILNTIIQLLHNFYSCATGKQVVVSSIYVPLSQVVFDKYIKREHSITFLFSFATPEENT